MLNWMAWTWPTAGFFIFIFGCIFVVSMIEQKRPGGAPRDGVFGLTTTRGDRLFISILGSILMCFAWIGFVGIPIWGGLALALIWSSFVFWKV